MRDIGSSTHGVAIAQSRSNTGVEQSRGSAQVGRGNTQRQSTDEEAAARLLLRRVAEQILKDLTRSLRREFRQQRVRQRLAQRRLIEQRQFEQSDIERRKRRAIAFGIDPNYGVKEERKWINTERSTWK